MKKKNNRRSFILNSTVGGIAASTSPQILAASKTLAETPSEKSPKERVQEHGKADNKQSSRKYNEPYEGDYLKRVAFPIGGIGVRYDLHGRCWRAISHVSVRNKPEMFIR